MKEAKSTVSQNRFLRIIERTGNKLPDPVFIFVYLIGILLVSGLVIGFDLDVATVGSFIRDGGGEGLK